MAKRQLDQSFDSLAGNVIQQFTGVLVFLVVPKFLGVEEYGQTVFVLTLWSFQAFSDLGFSHVYNRRLPALHAAGDRDGIRSWDATILKWRLAGATVFGVIAGCLYGFKYGGLLFSILVAIVPSFSAAFLFCISQATVDSDFAKVRSLNFLQAGARLLVIPVVALWNLPGWFVGQACIAAVVLISPSVRKNLRRSGTGGAPFSWNLIRKNFSSAVVLVLIVGLWTQLLSVARLIASFRYPDAVIATYGLATSSFQIVMLTLVSMYAPISVRTNALFGVDPSAAVNYVTEKNKVVLPAFLAFAIAAAAFGPWALRTVFSEYSLESAIVLPCLLSLLHVPAIVMFGSLLMASGKFMKYLTAVAASFLLSVVVAVLAEPALGVAAAALAQLVGLGALVLMQYVAVVSGDSMPAGTRWRLGAAVVFSLAVVLAWFALSPIRSGT